MKLIVDIETNGFDKPTHIWVVVCRDIVTGDLTVFRNPVTDRKEGLRCREFIDKAELIIGHNLVEFDLPVLQRLIGCRIRQPKEVLDTFILSRLIDYPREEKHSLESYGLEFGLLKGFKLEDGTVLESKYFPGSFFLSYSQDLENYCIRDTEITYKIYTKYKKYIDNPIHGDSILREHSFQSIVNNLSTKGFKLDTILVNKLYSGVQEVLKEIDDEIHNEFPPRLKLIREISPKATKFGTISLTSIPKAMRDNIHELSVDAPFSLCNWVVFNPGSPKQVVELLNKAGWQPEDKTDSHKEREREVSQLKRRAGRDKTVALTLQDAILSLDNLKIYGWKINEPNLSTLPDTAPKPARLLAKRILYESRRKTLVEWLGLVQPDGRVHGDFQGIGAWTHRMAHRKPNLANIANEFELSGSVKLLGKEMRQCWTVPKGKMLVGVDAESIQLRGFAHLINDPEFTNAIVTGDKKLKTDPHNFNKTVLGPVCQSRAAAKRFIFALLLGAGIGKLAEILECSTSAAQEALDRLLARYEGFAKLKEEVIPRDAERGWFYGIDGRRIRIPGDTVSQRRHLAMSGYLQSGEAIVIKEAAIQAEPLINELDSYFVDIVHDEYQIECPDDIEVCKRVAGIVDNCIRSTTSTFNLNCPMAGSYWNDDHNRYSFGKTWYETH